MTSSDDTALSPGALEGIAARVGRSSAGRPEDGASAVGGGARIAMVCAKFNGGITERLLHGALEALAECGLPSANVEVAWVPGAFELPVTASRLAASGRIDAVIALGAVIRGDTAHFEYVAGPCATGLAQVALETGVPVVFGVLTTEDVAQALARSEKGADNKGWEAACTALEMVDLLGRLPARPD
ncbi:MAG TPA: 6,7-dimethyl-8-ribityllumazine synthase [Acidimicrobiales bacterium]|nr:6,7-dimethyl-8-ribityllumazine synthase [Acidimicrobiales bacterium]